MPVLAEIKHELETWLPAYTFSLRTGLFGKSLVARNTNGHGATVTIKGETIVVQAIGPDLLTRLRLGAGAAYKKFADEHYTETAEKVFHFLGREYEVQLVK